MAADRDQQGQPAEAIDASLSAGDREAGAAVLARLAEREQRRAAVAAARVAELQVSANPQESVDAFMAEFAARRRQLEGALQALSGSGGGEGGGGEGGSAALADLAERIAELEKALADATYFLPAYDLRQATLALAALREQQEAAAAALQPRRRFAFNRKAPAKAPAATAPPSNVASDAAQPAAATAARAASAQQQEQQQPLQQQQQQGAAAAAPSAGTAISGLRGAVVAPGRAEAEGQELTLSDLEDCSVFLLAPLAALFLHGLRRCRVYTGPVAGACFVEGAEDCTLMLAARQVRIHAALRCDVYLRVRSHPIIEHSSALRFAPYAPAYEGAAGDLGAAGLEPDPGMWRQVNDFGWLRATPSPHWAVLPEAERAAAPAAAAHAAAPGAAAEGAAA